MPTPIHEFISEDDEPYDWLIPGVLERGDRLILTGREGKGKSTLLRQFAYQYSCGFNPFTLERIEPGKVLAIDLENPRKFLKRTFRHLITSQPYPSDMEIEPMPQGTDLLNPILHRQITKMIGDTNPDLLVIGPMYKMAPGLETEEASGKVAAIIDDWRILFGCAVMMESHQPHSTISEGRSIRPERPFGSSLWLRWPEFGICLEDDGTLRHWRGARDRRDWPEKLKWGSEPGDWPWMVDTRTCVVCMNPLSINQDKYCSTKCSSNARQRTHRAQPRLA